MESIIGRKHALKIYDQFALVLDRVIPQLNILLFSYSQSVQDPFGFNYNDQTEESSRGTRPRGGFKEKQKVNSKQNTNNAKKHKSLSDELDDLVNKAVDYVEKKLGRSLFNLSTDENSNSEDDSCDPESMIRTQNKCRVSNFSI